MASVTEAASGIPPPAAPPVSVVIPCYNAAATIARTIGSALAQGLPGTEIVVVDDGSTDASAELVRSRFAGRVRLIAGPNRGACHARNRGLAASSGGHVLFLDADDEIAGDHLAGSLKAAAAAGADIVLTAVDIRREGRPPRRIEPGETDPDRLLATWFGARQLNTNAVVWRRGFLERVGGWNESVLINQDGELMVRALLEGPRIALNPAGLAIYNRPPGGSVSTARSAAKMANLVETLGRLVELCEARGRPAAALALEDKLYATARQCFIIGCPEAARAALAFLAARGRAHHRGGLAHRLGAGLLGLERKIRLWGS